MPIVDGFENVYGNQMAFERLNALDSDVGQQTFDQLQLPGHPSYILFAVNGSEVWRGFGQQEAELLESAIQTALVSD